MIILFVIRGNDLYQLLLIQSHVLEIQLDESISSRNKKVMKLRILINKA